MIRRPGALGLFLAVLVAGVLTAGAAGAAPGDVTRVAGQGPDANCTADLRVDPVTGSPVLPPKTTGLQASSDTKWNYHTNFGAIAVGGGRLYVAQANRVRGPNGLVVGLAPGSVAATDPDGAPATKVSLGAIEALAADPAGNHLYFAERVTSGAASGQTRIWHVGLTAATPLVRNVATVGTVGGIAADASGRLFVGEASGGVSVAPPGRHPFPARGASRATSPASPWTRRVPTCSPPTPPATRCCTSMSAPGTDLSPSPARLARATPATTASRHWPASTAHARRRSTASVCTFIDQPTGTARVRRIDLETLTITTVVGPGAAGQAAALNVPGRTLAVSNRNVYLGDFNRCQVLMIESAVAVVPPVVNNPPAPPPPNNTGGTGGTGNATNPGADQGAPAPGSAQGSPGNASTAERRAVQAPAAPAARTRRESSPAPRRAPNTTGIISSTTGAEGAAAGPSPQGSAGGVETAAGWSTAANAPTAPAATPSAGSAPAPQPSAAPPPAPQPPAAPEAFAAVDPGATASAPADSAAEAGSVLPPGSPQPAGHVAPAGADDGAASRGAARYAMVRNDEEQPSWLGLLAMAGGGALVAVFLCVMLVAPRACLAQAEAEAQRRVLMAKAPPPRAVDGSQAARGGPRRTTLVVLGLLYAAALAFVQPAAPDGRSPSTPSRSHPERRRRDGQVPRPGLPHHRHHPAGARRAPGPLLGLRTPAATPPPTTC